jgi:uncharacterized membrane protein YjgN (DUF898 family)
MSVTTLTCPHCNYSKELPASVLPQPGTRVTCPRCKEGFLLRDEVLTTLPSADEEPFAASFLEEPVAAATGSGVPEPPAPALAPPATPSRPLQKRTLTFTFTGNAKEYFGIWIVNTLLRIVTLGIYSPWAKVRKRRYFYGNTLLNDAPFDYLADPMAILKGWFIAGAFFGLYSIASKVSPVLAVVFMFIMFGLLPWVVVRSRIFNLRNSSHRNIRFGFTPDYREAYRVFLWWQLLIPLTLGILAPYVVYRQKRFLVEQSSYGTTRFSFHATSREYYRVFKPLFIMIPLLVLSFASLASLGPKWGGNLLAALVPAILFPVVYVVAMIYVPTALANLTWNSTGIGSHRFVSTLRARDLAWIYISSAVAILLSLGMLAPWASVRLARYRLDRLKLTGTGDLAVVTAAAAEATSATGEELGDMLGYDFGL